VNAAIAEVDHLFRMPDRPSRIRPGVAGIRGGRGIAGPERQTHLHVIDQTCEPAVPDSLQFPIPAGDGQPDLQLDIGIGRGLDFGDDAAKRRQALVERRHIGPGEGRRRPMKRSCGDCLRQSNCDVRNLRARQALALVFRKCCPD